MYSNDKKKQLLGKDKRQMGSSVWRGAVLSVGGEQNEKEKSQIWAEEHLPGARSACTTTG